MTQIPLQDQYAPQNACFGCGPANKKGLQIKSYVKSDHVYAEFRPEKHHEAFDNMVCGGIIGTLLDCHCNWTAAYHLMKSFNEDKAPCTVTANYSIELLKPTPSNGVLKLYANPVKIEGRRADIEGHIEVDGITTAKCKGTFVAVKPGHPAHHRW